MIKSNNENNNNVINPIQTDMIIFPPPGEGKVEENAPKDEEKKDIKEEDNKIVNSEDIKKDNNS